MDTTAPPPSLAPAGYPAVLEVDRAEHVANWRPLVHWLLIIPHVLVLYVLYIVAEVVAFISWFAILFTGRMPEGMAKLIVLAIRYGNRVNVYYLFLREEYPPYSFDTRAHDPGDYPAVRTQLVPELDDRNRLTTAFRLILVIPHFIALAVLFLVAFFATIGGFFTVLFTGRWAAGLQEFVLGVLRWNTRVLAYYMLLTDEYPPFSME